MFYAKKMKADTLVNPHFYNSKLRVPNDCAADNQHLDKLQTNARIEDQPKLFGQSVSKMNPRAYNEFTKRVDNNYNKIGLRK